MWYSDMMTSDALMYILSITEITIGESDLKEEMRVFALAGEQWTKKQEADHQELIVENVVKAWLVKVPKLLSVLNLVYRDFIETCGEMYVLCHREKASRWNTLDCGLGRARIFTAIGIGAKLWCDLIIAQCTPYLRKDYSHPTGFGDTDTKAWLVKWQMWKSVKNISISILKGMLFCMYPSLEEDTLEDEIAIVEAQQIHDAAIDAFCNFLEEV